MTPGLQRWKISLIRQPENYRKLFFSNKKLGNLEKGRKLLQYGSTDSWRHICLTPKSRQFLINSRNSFVGINGAFCSFNLSSICHPANEHHRTSIQRVPIKRTPPIDTWTCVTQRIDTIFTLLLKVCSLLNQFQLNFHHTFFDHSAHTNFRISYPTSTQKTKKSFLWVYACVTFASYIHRERERER